MPRWILRSSAPPPHPYCSSRSLHTTTAAIVRVPLRIYLVFFCIFVQKIALIPLVHPKEKILFNTRSIVDTRNTGVTPQIISLLKLYPGRFSDLQ